MSTEYDVYQHPQLNPVVQMKVARAIQKIAKTCMRVCYRETPQNYNQQCFDACVANYIEAQDLVLETLNEFYK
jgi:hypothetical protein